MKDLLRVHSQRPCQRRRLEPILSASQGRCSNHSAIVPHPRPWGSINSGLRSLYMFFSLLRQACANDESLTWHLQIVLSLILSMASLISMFCALRSSIILSIQVFLCLPRLRVPSTCPYRAAAGSLLSFILVTCPNHVSLLFLILSYRHL